MDAKWIDQGDALANFCEKVGDVVAIDTESDHFHAYDTQMCLVQMATHDDTALVDPLAMDEDALAAFFDLLSDEKVTKVFHAGRNDILEIDRDYGQPVRSLYDTQIAARFLNLDGNSLSFLEEDLLGVAESPSFQKFDWTTRPLPEDKAEYAIGDVQHLLELQEILTERLEESGWLEPFRQQCEYVSTVRHEPNPFDPERWRKVRGAKGLDGPGRRAMSELYRWRHEMCRQVNRAPLHVFPDGALLHISRTRPTSLDELSTVRSLPQETLDAFGEEMIRVIEASATVETPPDKPPRKERRPRLPREVKARFKRLKKWRNETREELGIASEFVATNANLMEMAKDPPESKQALRGCEGVLQWHVDRFGDDILACL